MALDEEQSDAAQELRRAIDCLESSAELTAWLLSTLEALAAGAVHFSLPAGDLLFESGSTPDGVYLVASGRLGVRVPAGGRWTAEIERGEWVGEAGWLLKEPRSATVVALRDTELLLLPRRAARCVAARSPAFSLAIARLCARRLRRSNSSGRTPRRARVFALVPNSDEIDVIESATQLVGELDRCGPHGAGVGRARHDSHLGLVQPDRRTQRLRRLRGRPRPIPAGPANAAGRPTSSWDCARAGRSRVPWPRSVSSAAASRGTRMELA